MTYLLITVGTIVVSTLGAFVAALAAHFFGASEFLCGEAAGFTIAMLLCVTRKYRDRPVSP